MGNASIASHFVGMSGGFTMSVLAFIVVFLVISGLMLVMMGLKYFSNWVGSGAAAPKPQAAPAPAAVQKTDAVQKQDDEGELIAVLTAAITAMCGRGAAIQSYAPSRPAAGTPGGTIPAWKMTGILGNSRGLRD